MTPLRYAVMTSALPGIFLSAVLAFAVAGLVVSPLPGCASTPTAPATYEAEGLLCVDTAATRADADACRCGLERRYARPLKHCTASDAGKDGGQ
jgi:hypothetical protein